ncbi:UNVERIFIED_CONTAM: hypothetical protein GTU68_033368 [Idotea baltica]|nr:hypothetical protein [Idotea baltica]
MMNMRCVDYVVQRPLIAVSYYITMIRVSIAVPAVKPLCLYRITNMIQGAVGLALTPL